MGDERSTCPGPNCTERAITLGLCAGHYQQHHAGRELIPLGGKARYKTGDKVYHGLRPCTFVTNASPGFLMIAALLRNHCPADQQWASGVADRCVNDKPSVKFVVYDDDGSIGMLSANQLSRQPKERSRPHGYAQQKP